MVCFNLLPSMMQIHGKNFPHHSMTVHEKDMVPSVELWILCDIFYTERRQKKLRPFHVQWRGIVLCKDPPWRRKKRWKHLIRRTHPGSYGLLGQEAGVDEPSGTSLNEVVYVLGAWGKHGQANNLLTLKFFKHQKEDRPRIHPDTPSCLVSLQGMQNLSEAHEDDELLLSTADASMNGSRGDLPDLQGCFQSSLQSCHREVIRRLDSQDALLRRACLDLLRDALLSPVGCWAVVGGLLSCSCKLC